jgi:hypothetical protein
MNQTYTDLFKKVDEKLRYKIFKNIGIVTWVQILSIFWHFKCDGDPKIEINLDSLVSTQ